MAKDTILLEGKRRVVAEIQTLFQHLTGKYMNKKRAEKLFEKIFGIIFDEVFRFGRFHMPPGYGSIVLHRRKFRLKPDKEYKQLEPNYEDETGIYYVSFHIKVRPGSAIKAKLRNLQNTEFGDGEEVPYDTDVMQILEYFQEIDDVEP